MTDFQAPVPVPAGSTLVIGFLGGFEKWNDEHRGVRKLALRLRDSYGVFAETVENRHSKRALQFILRAAGNAPHPRIILYGQSWGAAAAVRTARDLESRGIPVLLTVQVDSVGPGDALIPANVTAALNFYQHDPLTIQGRRLIRAADPRRTTILGNFELSYVGRGIDSGDASWARRTFGGGHAKMELDPEIWTRVEHYIKDAIAR